MKTKEELIAEGRMLTAKDVMTMWQISYMALWRLTRHKNAEKRIPSYKLGQKRLYKYDELTWYMDNHKITK